MYPLHQCSSFLVVRRSIRAVGIFRMASALVSQLTQFFKLEWSGPRSNGTGESSAKDRTRDKAPSVVIVMARWEVFKDSGNHGRANSYWSTRIVSRISSLYRYFCLATVSRGGHRRKRHVWREIPRDGSSFSRRAEKACVDLIKILGIFDAHEDARNRHSFFPYVAHFPLS